MGRLGAALAGLALCVACGGGHAPVEAADGGSAAPQSASATSPGAPSGPVRIQLPPPGTLYHGVLPAGSSQPDSDVDPANLDAYEHTVGRSVAYVYFTNNWFKTKQFPEHTCEWIRTRGAVPFIRMSMRSQMKTTVTDPRYTLTRIISGEFDGEIGAWADGARAFGTPLIVEYGTEVNGDWFPWSAPYNGGLDVAPALFRQAYRHIVGVMRAHGATNITWALHYNVQNYPQDPRNVPSAYYPGDDVVDWVGVSAYGSERPYDHRCPTFAQLLEDMLPQLKAATTQKPFFIFEFGITGNNPRCDPGTWVTAALSDLLGGRWPELRGFAWWNERWENDSNPADDSDMQVQDVPAVGDAFHSALTGPQAGVVTDHPLTGP